MQFFNKKALEISLEIKELLNEEMESVYGGVKCIERGSREGPPGHGGGTEHPCFDPQ